MNDVILTEASQGYIKKSSPWFRFIAILSLIGTICMFLFALGMLIMGIIQLASAVRSPDSREAMASLGMGIMYVIMAPFTLVGTIFMLRASKAIKTFKNTAPEQATGQILDPAFKNLKSLVKFWGIILIVLLALMVIGLIIVIIAGVAVGVSGLNLSSL
jgi:cytochrome b561